MSSEQIQQFLDSIKRQANQYVMITFKKREPLFGLFLKDNGDYGELKTKNFWRIVTRKNLDEYVISKNETLSRIFAGSEFQKLITYDETF